LVLQFLKNADPLLKSTYVWPTTVTCTERYASAVLFSVNVLIPYTMSQSGSQ
jgi:hypothetical protein